MQLRANHLTISRILLLPIPCVLIFGGPIEKLVGLAIFSALGATDWYDGKLARKQGPTVLGGLLDPVADKMFLAFTYLPMARIEGEWGSGVAALPLWLVTLIFFRDFVVTSLRSITAAHDVEFHTATLAKFKTAIQMGAGGFFMWAIALHGYHAAQIAGFAAAVAVIVVIVVVRLAKKRTVGSKIWVQLGAFGGALVAVILLRTSDCLLAIGLGVLSITLVSGGQYVVRTFRGLAEARWPAPAGELALAAAETLAPVAAVTLYAIPSVPAWAPIAMVTAELATGGLDNLLATEKIRRRASLAWLRCIALFGLAAAGWAGALRLPETPLAPAAAMASAGVAALYAIGLFATHRKVYVR